MIASLLAKRCDGAARETDAQHARGKLHIARRLGVEEGHDLTLGGIVIIEHDAMVRVVEHLSHHGMLGRDAPLVGKTRLRHLKRTFNVDSAADEPVIMPSMSVDRYFQSIPLKQS
ncbi:hypothetical protein [Aurantimonas marianensis]|uniref:Uncharacterized protein n=1 Tax=Aurantimonas marianensis TaxID=2920428 RepID=A0A9X2KJ87_9HYPH|nr:hypothetical protein [Aurantimonas marianensis]MCP3056397.1 hypothetical protein [Aurantimonas marianensis]